jgi:sugar O-acyltransferase (sialic acid O-acetyltransferase NeuD family)
MQVLIIGAGGHAQVVADILLRTQEQHPSAQLIGYLDDNPALHGQRFLNLPVLGAIDQLASIPHDAVIVAIGDNRTRAGIFAAIQVRGEKIINAIHPSAVIASDVRLGQGVMICAGVVVNTGTTIGDNVILNTSCSVDHHNHIAAHSHVAPGVHLGGDAHVGEGVLVGIGTAVIPGCSVGDWAIVGAGSVVTRDIPPFVTVLGAPARVIRRHESGQARGVRGTE